jgi:hypothetical protein
VQEQPVVKQLARRVIPAAGIVLAWLPACAITIVVSPSGPIASIQAGIGLAQPADLVSVAPGTYYERLVLKSGVRIAALQSGSVVVDAEGEGSAVTAVGVDAGAVVSGIVFRSGSAQLGGGLYGVATNAIFTDCIFLGNVGVLGGGVYLRDGSRASFDRCQFVQNVAASGGAMYLDFSPITVTSSSMNANQANDGSALAANNAAEAILTSITIFGNTAVSGATLACNDASPRFTSCTISDNLGGDSVFGLRSSGTRIERCIVSFNAGDFTACIGAATPWIGCNLVYSNGSDVMCGGDQGTNSSLDPLFCDRAHGDFTLAENSPAASGACNLLGAFGVACPAQGVDTAVKAVTWSHVKRLFSN